VAAIGRRRQEQAAKIAEGSGYWLAGPQKLAPGFWVPFSNANLGRTLMRGSKWQMMQSLIASPLVVAKRRRLAFDVPFDVALDLARRRRSAATQAQKAGMRYSPKLLAVQRRSF
jgi:hypothetical protein